MTEQKLCPDCTARLKLHRKRVMGELITRRRTCELCNYADVAYYHPEQLVRVRKVVRRRTT